MVVIFAHFVPFWIKKGIFTRVEPSGDAPQWPPEVLPVLRHTNHSHKILGGSKKRFFEYLGWATVPYLSQQDYDTINCQRYRCNINNELSGVANKGPYATFR